MRSAEIIAALLQASAVAGSIGPGLVAAHPGQQVPLGSAAPVSGPHRRQPNVVFILTDDQDVHLASLDYMPLVKKHLRNEGTSFSRHYATTAVCCPSRVTLWTGRFAHNTNVTDVIPPYGMFLRGWGICAVLGTNPPYLRFHYLPNRVLYSYFQS